MTDLDSLHMPRTVEFIRRLLFWFRVIRARQYCVPSFSQEGEDLLLLRLLRPLPNSTGLYVDVGAHHPIRFSNTYRFYLLGWHGINIDADDNAIKLLKKMRPRDINVCAAVSSAESDVVFHKYDEPALNTISPERANYLSESDKISPISTHVLRTQKLRTILRSHLCDNAEIAFLSIDAEGADIEVLRSNDWDAFRPRYVFVESSTCETVLQAQECELSTYLNSVGYSLKSKLGLSLLYENSRRGLNALHRM